MDFFYKTWLPIKAYNTDFRGIYIWSHMSIVNANDFSSSLKDNLTSCTFILTAILLNGVSGWTSWRMPFTMDRILFQYTIQWLCNSHRTLVAKKLGFKLSLSPVCNCFNSFFLFYFHENLLDYSLRNWLWRTGNGKLTIAQFPGHFDGGNALHLDNLSAWRKHSPADVWSVCSKLP